MKRINELPAFPVQEYMETVLENLNDGIYITDSEANTVYLNHSYELISGLTKSEMLGKNMRSLVRDGVISMSGTLSVLETNKSITSEQSFRTGKRAIITSTPVFDDTDNPSRILMVVTIVREITEIYSIRKELARLEQQNRQYFLELQRLKKELNGDVEIIAEDAASTELIRLAERVSMIDAPVLISGESGVGKEKTARFIHNHSRRLGCPFIRISLSVASQDDPAKYLFGYEDTAKGEYHMGVLENADGGTVYFDEIKELPQTIKDRILTLLRDGSCIMGDGTNKKLNVRIISGSKDTFQKLQHSTDIEPDILNCFSLFPLQLLPLRERKDDIIPLVHYFLSQYNRKTGEKKYFSRSCYPVLLEYDWPGNVRELQIAVQRAAVVSPGNVIEKEDLSFGNTPPVSIRQRPGEYAPFADNTDLKLEVAKFESQYMSHAFSKYGNIREAAESLGMDSSTFVRKRQRYEKMGLMKKTSRKQ